MATHINKAFFSELSPAQITANQNNYNPTGLDTASVLRVSSDAARDITGLVGGVKGRLMFICNTGSFNITLKNESTSSTAANRFRGTADIVVKPKEEISFVYDGVDSRWQFKGFISSGGGPPGTWVQIDKGPTTVSHDVTTELASPNDIADGEVVFPVIVARDEKNLIIMQGDADSTPPNADNCVFCLDKKTVADEVQFKVRFKLSTPSSVTFDWVLYKVTPA